MCTTVVSGVNSAPVLEPAKHVLDFMTLLVELAVMRYWDLSVRPRWNAGLDFALRQGLSKPVGIVAFVGQ